MPKLSILEFLRTYSSSAIKCMIDNVGGSCMSGDESWCLVTDALELNTPLALQLLLEASRQTCISPKVAPHHSADRNEVI